MGAAGVAKLPPASEIVIDAFVKDEQESADMLWIGLSLLDVLWCLVAPRCGLLVPNPPHRVTAYPIVVKHLD
jgi:hypothetical protein